MSSDELDKASQPEPFSKTRRAHNKSRAGCFNCRKRRVKCDEKHPVCRSCRRREAQCVWPEASPTHFLLSGTSVTGYHERSWEAVSKPWRNTSLGTRQTFRGSPSAVSEPSSAPSFAGARSVHVAAIPGETYKLSDLALMHHWTRSTSVQTGVPKDHVEFFQSIIPEVGFTNPFVSHAILSVAALHIAHLSKIDREQHIIRAVQHHNAGLEGFRNAVSAISEENSEALFIWSTLNSLYVLSLATQSSLQAMDRKDTILGVEWIPMLQGVTTVLHPVLEHLQQGRVKNMLTLPGWKDLDPDMPSDGWLNTPLSRVWESWKDSPHALTYVAALSVLRKCMLFVSQFDGTDGKASDELGYNRALSGSLVFIHASPRDFFTLLHKREPPALILFAYFGVLLHGQRDCWVIDSLGRDILEVVGELLDSRWKRWLPKGTDFPKATLSCGF